MIPLPQWMAGEIADAWAEYVAQRVKDKKAMTPRSAIARVKRLQELKDAGHDPLHCLDEAINGHWLDFYEPKEKPISKAVGSAADSTRQYLREQSTRGTKPPAAVLELTRKMRQA